MSVTILKEGIEYPEVSLENPNGLTKGFYLSKCKEEVLFQLPILKSKSGVVLNQSSNYIDLIIESDNNLVKSLFLHLEEKTKEEIKKRQNIWFSNELLDDDINYYFLDTVKGKVLRVDVPDNLYVFNKDHEKLELKDIKGKDLICILEFVGLRFSTTSFKLHFNLKQVMVYESKYEKCIVQTESSASNEPQDDIVILEENESTENTLVQDPSPSQENTALEDAVPEEKTASSDAPPEENTAPEVQSQENDTTEASASAPPQENTSEDVEQEITDNEDENSESETDDSDEDDTLSEVAIEDLVKDDEEIMKLEKPTDIYKKTYYETYERAKAAKQYAIKTFLEAKKIKQLHLLNDLESSDEEDLNFN